MRLFTAIDFPKEINDYLFFLQSFFNDVQGVQLVKSFHLTLKFFGEAELEPIIKSLDLVKERQFDLKLSNLGLFPNEKNPRVIWIGINQELKLINLQKNIDSLFKESKPEFDFHPHITLARCSTKIILPNLVVKPFTFKVTEFKLYQSIITKDGLEYKEIKSFNLHDM